MILNKMFAIALLAWGMVGLASTAGAQSRPADFGEQWVRDHPFTIGALAQVPALVDGAEYRGAGLNTFLAWRRPEGLLPIAAGQNMPWHFHVSETSLTPDVMNEVNTAYSTHPGNTGWLVHDESRRLEMPAVAQVADWIKQQAPNTLVYANVLPMGANAAEYYGDASNPSYEYSDYLNDTMTIIRPDVLMYDFYPFSPGGVGVSSFYYVNMMRVRGVARNHGVPYWAFIQAYEKLDKPFDRRLPSESDIRFQMFSHLTAGYTGFHHFTYDPALGRGLVDGNGDPTPLYPAAAQANAEVQVIGNALRLMENVSVRYIANVGNPVPEGLEAWNPAEDGNWRIDHLAVDTNPIFGDSMGPWKDGLIGFFTDDRGEEYLLITNAYHGEGLSAVAATLHFEVRFEDLDELLWLNPLTGQSEVIHPDPFNVFRLTIPGGTGMLFKRNNGVDFLVPEPASAGTLLIAATLLLRRRRPHIS